MERLCKDCKHFTGEITWDEPLMSCLALRGKLHPVLGVDIDHIEAGMMRLTLCGWSDPKFWEPKPK